MDGWPASSLSTVRLPKKAPSTEGVQVTVTTCDACGSRLNVLGEAVRSETTLPAATMSLTCSTSVPALVTVSVCS